MYDKTYYEQNKEYFKSYYIKYYQNHKEKIIKNAKKYYDENKEFVLNHNNYKKLPEKLKVLVDIEGVKKDRKQAKKELKTILKKQRLAEPIQSFIEFIEGKRTILFEMNDEKESKEEKLKTKNQLYYQKHKEFLKNKTQLYYFCNQDFLKNQSKQYYYKNRQSILNKRKNIIEPLVSFKNEKTTIYFD